MGYDIVGDVHGQDGKLTALLAKVLGYSAEEIRAALPAVLAFFTVAGDEIFCPELDDYRAYRARIRRDQVESAKATNRKRKNRGEAHG